MIDEVFLKDFRSFRGEHNIPLRPITVLVGENSAGKTSMLAAISSMSNEGIASLPEVGREPYRFSGYKSLGSDGSKDFQIGFKITGDLAGTPSRILTKSTFESDAARVVLSKLQVEVEERFSSTFARRPRAGGYDIDVQLPPHFGLDGPVRLGSRGLPVENPTFADLRNSARYSGRLTKEQLQYILDSTNWMLRTRTVTRRAISISPIRTKPQRVYESNEQGRSPEGEHVPFTVRDMQRSKSAGARDFRKRFHDFGEKSGLFGRLRAKPLGSISGDAFELSVDILGTRRSLADVGYGVSQVLPIVSDVVSGLDQSLFLVQQPEVHLHPRSQAELASFFASQYREQDKRFVIETHSDYIIDRLRVEVKRGNLKPSDVSILFLENRGNGTEVTVIQMDADGELGNAPDGFRGFFLQEQRSLFGWDS